LAVLRLITSSNLVDRMTNIRWGLPMSQLGHLQTSGEPNQMSALPPKADIISLYRHVCFGPIADIASALDHLVPAQVARVHSGNPAFRRPSIIRFGFVCPPRAIHAEIVRLSLSVDNSGPVQPLE
jgi:hypothetical protein